MTGSIEAEKIGRDGRGNAVVVASEAGAGLQTVNECENAGASDETDGIAADLTSERDKDAMDFSLLLFDEANEFVVLLDGFEGLDVDRLPGRAGTVDDTGDAAFEFAANGDDESVTPDGDEVFLGCAVAGELAQRRAEGFFDLALLAFLLAADAV